MRLELLLIGIVLIAGCIGGEECALGQERCIDTELQSCVEGKWRETGECDPPVAPSEILSSPKSYENDSFDIEGTISEIGAGKIELDNKVWVECSSKECLEAKAGRELRLTVSTDYARKYNITYTFAATRTLQAERYELAHYTFPVSTEGAITTGGCAGLAGKYFVENGRDPADSTEHSLMYVGFYENDLPSQDSYNQMVQSICWAEGANIISPYSDDTSYLWCAKIRGGGYCYVSTNSFIRDDWDWELPLNEVIGKTGVPAIKNIESLCSEYGGTMLVGIEKHLLQNVYAFRAPVCQIKILSSGKMKNTTTDCENAGGTVDGGECLVVDQDAWDECGNNNNVPEGYMCILKSDCYDKGGTFDSEDGEYYCTDSAGITKSGIFNSYGEDCIYGLVTICNLESYTIESETITEYTLRESQ